MQIRKKLNVNTNHNCKDYNHIW